MPPRLEIKTAPIQPRQGREAGKPQRGTEGNRFGAGFVAGATIAEPSYAARMTGATVAEKPSGITKMSITRLGELSVTSSNISGTTETADTRPCHTGSPRCFQQGENAVRGGDGASLGDLKVTSLTPSSENTGNFKTHPSECTHGCRPSVGEKTAGTVDSPNITSTDVKGGDGAVLGEINVSTLSLTENAGDFKTGPSECTHSCYPAVGDKAADRAEPDKAGTASLKLEVSSLTTDQSDDKSAQEGTSALGACSNYGPDCKRNNSLEPTIKISAEDVKGGDGTSLSLDVFTSHMDEPTDSRTSVFACATRNSNNHNCC